MSAPVFRASSGELALGPHEQRRLRIGATSEGRVVGFLQPLGAPVRAVELQIGERVWNLGGVSLSSLGYDVAREFGLVDIDDTIELVIENSSASQVVELVALIEDRLHIYKAELEPRPSPERLVVAELEQKERIIALFSVDPAGMRLVSLTVEPGGEPHAVSRMTLEFREDRAPKTSDWEPFGYLPKGSRISALFRCPEESAVEVWLVTERFPGRVRDHEAASIC